VRLAINITHPNVCRINHTTSAAPFRIIVMEYVRGGTLRERLARGPIPAKEALGIFRGICEGVRAAHDRDVLHLDLKPGNVLLRDGVLPVVCDFGLATTSGSSARGGTEGYMAPEQVGAGRSDQRADVYALGRILSDLVPSPSRELRRLITQACAESPEARFATVAEVLAHLDRPPRRTVLVRTGAIMLAALGAVVAIIMWKGVPNDAKSTLLSAAPEKVETPLSASIESGAPGTRSPMPEEDASSSVGDTPRGGNSAPRPTPRTGSLVLAPTPTAPAAVEMRACCGALEVLSKKHPRPNVMNVSSACTPLVAAGNGGTIKSMVENNLSCKGLPPPCEPVPVPAECK